jgi:hypothetical protein
MNAGVIGAKRALRQTLPIAPRSTGSGNVDGTGAAARFTAPSGVATDGAGNLYVTDSNSQTIRKIVLQSGVVSTLAGTAGMSGSVTRST